jgi:hypothetical protein
LRRYSKYQYADPALAILLEHLAPSPDCLPSQQEWEELGPVWRWAEDGVSAAILLGLYWDRELSFATWSLTEEVDQEVAGVVAFRAPILLWMILENVMKTVLLLRL